MKAFIVIIVLAFLVAVGVSSLGNDTTQEANSISYPAPTGYVVDDAQVLNDLDEQYLTAQITTLKDKAEIAVVTVKTLGGLTVEEYSIKLAENWKVGNKDMDNGVIILIATQDRKVRIEVGHGLEGEINDATAGRILDTAMVPHLKNNEWAKALVAGVEGVGKELNK